MPHFLMVLMLCALWPSVTIAAEASVSIGVHHYPPFSDAQGEGLLADIIEAAYAAEGVEARMVPLPIRRGLVHLKTRQVDAMAAGNIFSSTAELKQLVSTPILNVLTCMFFYIPHFNDPDRIQSLEDLKGYRVGVTVNSPYLDLYTQSDLKVFEILTPEQLLGMTKKGRSDFFESTLLTGLHLIQQIMPTESQDFDYIHWDVLEADLSFHSNHPQAERLKQQFEAGMQQLREQGKLLRILESYWGKGNVPQAVFIQQYPMQGTESPTAEKYRIYSRGASGKISSPD